MNNEGHFLEATVLHLFRIHRLSNCISAMRRYIFIQISSYSFPLQNFYSIYLKLNVYQYLYVSPIPVLKDVNSIIYCDKGSEYLINSSAVFAVTSFFSFY